MKSKKLPHYLFTLIFICFTKVLSAQQPNLLEPATEIVKIDTIVIRRTQEKIKIIPRSVNLVYPSVTFKETIPLNKKFKRFRIPSFWEKVNKISLTASEVAFVNWNAGGNNSISLIASGKFERNYKFRYVQWDNDLNFRYGANTQEGQKPRKTDDAIRLSSTFGFRRDTVSNWYYSVKANFNTQFYRGYKYPNRETAISRLMAPGYAFLGAGTSYIPEGKKFNFYVSPLTLKATFVLDQELADKGSFGVQKAILDTNGNVLKEGENRVIELGFLINNTWETTVAKNIAMNNRISLYSDYLNSFGNVDVDWELTLKLVVNKYINANIGTHIIYDDDILFDAVKDANGIVVDQGVQRIQFKQLLGVGVAYDF